jgi:hypothetical protein
MLLGFTVPPAVHNILELLYGEDKWYRAWAMVMTFCAVLCLVRATRRLGAIGFVGFFVVANIWNFINVAYKQFTPQ